MSCFSGLGLPSSKEINCFAEVIEVYIKMHFILIIIDTIYYTIINLDNFIYSITISSIFLDSEQNSTIISNFKIVAWHRKGKNP